MNGFPIENIAGIVKAALHKLPGKLNLNVNFVYLDYPVCSVSPVCPISPVCPDDHGDLNDHDHHGDHDDHVDHVDQKTDGRKDREQLEDSKQSNSQTVRRLSDQMRARVFQM